LDPLAALDFAKTNPDNQFVATTELATWASKWLLDHPGEASQRRMDEVYSQWPNIDQKAALDSIAALPAGPNRSNALSGVVGTLAKTDPAAALSLIDRFPNDVTEPVMKNFLWNSLQSAPPCSPCLRSPGSKTRRPATGGEAAPWNPGSTAMRRRRKPGSNRTRYPSPSLTNSPTN